MTDNLSRWTFQLEWVPFLWWKRTIIHIFCRNFNLSKFSAIIYCLVSK